MYDKIMKKKQVLWKLKPSKHVTNYIITDLSYWTK